jgi:hypothetical protein
VVTIIQHFPKQCPFLAALVPGALEPWISNGGKLRVYFIQMGRSIRSERTSSITSIAKCLLVYFKLAITNTCPNPAVTGCQKNQNVY